MPLCGQKKWHPAAAIDSDDDVLHTIDLTGERFSRFEDYKKRMAEYGENKWTCQVTGKHHLTFEEAFKSEQQSKLQIELRFTFSMQKALLVFIHHNFLQKKFLVEGMKQILKKSFFEGEYIKMNLKQTVMGKVESVCSEKDGSPNSNKENQKKYDVRTLSEGSSSSKLVRGVPHEYIERKTPLSDEDLNQFIATYATRASQSSPWVIAADLKTAHGIKDKVHSLFATSPASVSKAKSTPKAAPIEKSTPKAAPVEKSTPKAAPVEKRRSDAAPDKVSHVNRHRLPSTSSEDSDADLQVVRRSSGVAPAAFKAKKQMKNLAKTQKKAPPLVDLTSERSSSKQSRGGKLTDTRPQSTSNKTMDHYFKSKTDKRDTDNSSANDSDDFVTTSSVKKTQSVKKAASLSPAKQMQKRVDSMVQRAEMHLAKHQTKLFKIAISMAAKSLNDNQIAAIKNEQIRKAIEKCKAQLDEQNTLDKMTADERTEYLAQKAAQIKQEMHSRRVEAAKIARLKFEDTSLTDLTALPVLEPVVLPESVSPSCFGDALMVTEFVHRFRDLLGDDHSKPVSATQLLTDMTAGQRGYERTTAKLLESMLHTLLADDVAKDYSTLCTKLNSLTTNKSTAAELTRLALRRKDDDMADHDEEEGDGDNRSDSRRSRSKSPFESHSNDIDNSILVDLERTEFYDLSVSDQISVLRVLVGRLLDSYSLNEFVDSFRERIESAEEEREKVRLQEEELRKRKAEIDAEIAANSAEDSAGQRETTPCGDGVSAAAPPTPDMKTKLQRYREEKTLAAAEQQRLRQVEDRQRRLQHVEAEIAQVRARLEAANKSVMDLEIEKNLAKRVQALGTDRSHRRYWFFRNGANPGLFVEDGWVGKEMAYSCFDAESQIDKKGSITNFYQPTEAVSERPQTFPQLESNRWFQLSLASFDQVFAALHPKGERESALRLNIQCLRTHIRDSIALQEQKTEPEKTDEVEDESTDGFAAAFKQTLEDTGRATRESGFGGVEDFDLWLGRLASADSLPQLIDLLLECQQGVHDRFLRGRMKIPAASTANKDAESSSLNSDEVAVSKLLARWIEMVKECATISRLHVLLYVFDAYIDWDKSLKNQKCRTCRKKKDTENMLLCDDCSDGYHMYCLRPKLKRMPRGDWFCRACKHKHERKVRYTFDDDDDDDDARIEKPIKSARQTIASSLGRRAHFEDDEDEDEDVGVRRSKRNLPVKEVTVSLSRSGEPKTKRAKHSSESDKLSEMEELTSSRTSTSLFADLPEVPISTRSRKSPVVQNLSDIEKKLGSYTALDELFADFGAFYARSKDTFMNQPRKLAKLETVEEELSECMTQNAG